MRWKNVKKLKDWHHLSLFLFLTVLAVLLIVLGMNVKQFSWRQLNPVVETAKKQSQVSSADSLREGAIVGTYRDDKDGAAIVLNEDGTGRYVYADKNNPDTDDQLTWKKQGEEYAVNLQDKNVENPLTAKLTAEQLVITGNGAWNTETFQRVNGSLNLNDFLREKHSGN